MDVRDLTVYLIRRIVADHKDGLALSDLLHEAVKRSRDSNASLYLGPGWTLRQFLEALSSEGQVILSTEGQTLRVAPTASFRVESQPDLDRMLKLTTR